MTLNSLLAGLDANIASLKTAREHVQSVLEDAAARPRAVKRKAKAKTKTSRHISTAGLKRIAAAQKKRWAKHKKEAAKK